MKLSDCQDYVQTDSSEMINYQISFPIDTPRSGCEDQVNKNQICYDMCKRDWSLTDFFKNQVKPRASDYFCKFYIGLIVDRQSKMVKRIIQRMDDIEEM